MEPRTRDHTLPSGLSGVIRNWKTRDLRVFTTPKVLRQPGPTIESGLMRDAWLDTAGRGPLYSFPGKPPWMQEVVAADMQDAVRIARILTWGPIWWDEYECKGCGKADWDEVDLEALTVLPLSAEAIRIYQANEEVSFTIPGCGVKVGYKLLTGDGFVHADRLAKQHGRHWDVKIAARLTRIDGVKSRGHFVRFVGDLDADDTQALDEELDRLSGGIQTDRRETSCSHCYREQERDLVFGMDFFRPDPRKVRELVERKSSAQQSESTSPVDSTSSESESGQDSPGTSSTE